MKAKDFVIFKAGHWNGEDFTEQDLDNMVSNFNAQEPIPIIVGHSSDYKGHTRIPAFGKIMGGLKRIGKDLIACGVEFNDKLANWIREGFYNQRSIELTRDNKRVLAVGMLGAVPPGVKGLPNNDESLTEIAMQFADEFDSKVIEFYEKEQSSFAELSAVSEKLLNAIERTLIDGITEKGTKEMWELQAEMCESLAVHEDYLKKIEVEKKPSLWHKMVKKLFNKRKEQDEMDAQMQKDFEDKITALETVVKEFQDADQARLEAQQKAEEEAKLKAEAEEKAKAEADAKASEEAQVEETKQFCDKQIAEGKMTPAMRVIDEPIMLKLAKDSEALKSFRQKYTESVVPLGEVKDVNQTNDQRPQVIVSAEQYVKQHPKEFADVEPAIRIQRALYLHRNGKIKFEGDK